MIDMAENEAISIITTETRNLRALPFTVTEDQLIAGKEWEDWLEAIEREFRYFKIINPMDKKCPYNLRRKRNCAPRKKAYPTLLAIRRRVKMNMNYSGKN